MMTRGRGVLLVYRGGFATLSCSNAPRWGFRLVGVIGVLALGGIGPAEAGTPADDPNSEGIGISKKELGLIRTVKGGRERS